MMRFNQIAGPITQALLLSLLALFPLLAPPAAESAEGPRFYAGGKAYGLDMDPGRVVVHVREGQAPADIWGEGLVLVNGDTLEGGGRFVFSVTAAIGPEAMARRLAGIDGVAWASPVYLLAGYERIATDRVLARFPEGADADAAAAAVGLRVRGPFAALPEILVLEQPAGSGPDAVEAAARLVEEGLALWAHPDFLRRHVPAYTPSDISYPNQWHLNNTGQRGGRTDVDVNAPEGWDLMPPDARLGHSDVIIAIVDTGTNVNHEDLRDNIWVNPGEVPNNGVDDDLNGFTDDVNGWDFLDNDPSPAPPDSHGTSVAGVAAARGDNSQGVTGICGGCRIMPIRLIGGFFGDSTVAMALAYAAANGAAIINNSWTPGAPVSPLPDSVAAVIDQAVDGGYNGWPSGVTMMWGAGNDAGRGDTVDTNGYASYEKVMAVGAITDQGGWAGYSEPGNTLDLVAPSNGGAAGITTTSRNGYTNNFGGTSSACPKVAGVAGLVLSARPRLHPAKVQKILEETAETSSPGILRPSYDPYLMGKGLVRADGAVAAVMSGPLFERLSYECIDQDVVVTVRDASASGSVVVGLTSGQTGDSENVSCPEVAARPGLFDCVIRTEWSLSPVPGDGTLVVGPTDTLTASYAGQEDTAAGTCNDAGCSTMPAFLGLREAESSAPCSGSGPVLRWDPPSSWGSGGPGWYSIYRSTEPGFTPGPANLLWASVDGTRTSWVDIFAVAGTTYYYAVRAENDETLCDGSHGGLLDDNSVVMAATVGGNEPPLMRADVRVSRRTDGTVEVGWGEQPGALAFDLYRGEFGGGPFGFAPYCFSGDLAGDTVAAIDNDPAPGGPGSGYYYLVTGENACGVGDFGDADVARTPPPACP